MDQTPGKNELFNSLFVKVVKPVAKKFIFSTVSPGPGTKWLYSGIFQLDFFGRELYEWGRRSLVATPVFLARCASFGDDIAIERIPYLTGPCRIELGSSIRFAGQINILVGNNNPLLKIGNGVFVGHETTFGLASRIELGDYVGIGERTYITDTEGHKHYNPNRPIWEVSAGEEEIGPVVIEDNVQIGQDCMILKGVHIGARAVIGAGAVVRSNIPADAVVMGNPARVVKRMKPPADVAKESQE